MYQAIFVGRGDHVSSKEGTREVHVLIIPKELEPWILIFNYKTKDEIRYSLKHEYIHRLKHFGAQFYHVSDGWYMEGILYITERA